MSDFSQQQNSIFNSNESFNYHQVSPKTVSSRYSPKTQQHHQSQMREKHPDRSHSYYQNSRVNSCSYVLVKAGAARAVPYYSSSVATEPSSVLGSISSPRIGQLNKLKPISNTRDSYSFKQPTSAGQRIKPLEPYTMNAERSRLYVPKRRTIRSNSGTFVIGDPSIPYKKNFITTNHAYFHQPDVDLCLQSNNGILSDIIKQHHQKQKS